ncbi:hypothetical protein BXZ70DRAFT_945890 [Cristinia sonorae]|uniref:Uncharacterized protein n=1 Tax=Cristinia sonorae TaxID=1940300 RepID=A0A8K0ULD5_9AGAR|nr:hypothetical protein BXZ70DRAFT_945890 [Cristinia sonorae]
MIHAQRGRYGMTTSRFAFFSLLYLCENSPSVPSYPYPSVRRSDFGPPHAHSNDNDDNDSRWTRTRTRTRNPHPSNPAQLKIRTLYIKLANTK